MSEQNQIKISNYFTLSNSTKDFLIGTVAGISGLIVGFPFDTVKVRKENEIFFIEI